MGEDPPEEGTVELGGLTGEGDLSRTATKPRQEDFEDPDEPSAGAPPAPKSARKAAKD